MKKGRFKVGDRVFYLTLGENGVYQLVEGRVSKVLGKNNEDSWFYYELEGVTDALPEQQLGEIRREILNPLNIEYETEDRMGNVLRPGDEVLASGRYLNEEGKYCYEEWQKRTFVFFDVMRGVYATRGWRHPNELFYFADCVLYDKYKEYEGRKDAAPWEDNSLEFRLNRNEEQVENDQLYNYTD